MSTIDQNLAPAGYYAVLESDVSLVETMDICTACDWRRECRDVLMSTIDQNHVPDNHQCMSYARTDNIGVVFKLINSVEL